MKGAKPWDYDAAVEEGRREVLDLLVRLVQAKSENPPGDTSEPSAVIEDYLSDNGFSVRKHEPERGFINLLASLGSGEEELTFCGHIDTVPAGDPEKWAIPPYEGRMASGRVYGRGSTDMKAGCASLAFAFVRAARLEKDVGGRLVLCMVADEESGGRRGVQSLISSGLLRTKNLVLGEPTNHRGTGHVVVAGEKGVYWAKVTLGGVSRHGSLPMLGENAILKAQGPLKRLSYPFLGKVTTPYSALTLVRETKKVLSKEYVDEARKKPHFAADHYTVNVGVIKGGTKVNVVPDSVSMELDVRVPLGGTKEEAERLLKARLPKDADVEVINYAQPAYTPPSSRLVRMVREAGREVFGEETPAICLTATTDAHHFRTSLEAHAVAYGPGMESMCHVVDEYVEASEVLGACKVYLRLAQWMLTGGARPIDPS
jgi:succinyl-diaminopimelate desuccinylase